MAEKEVIVLDHDALKRVWLYDKIEANAISEAQADAIWRQYQEETRAAANYGAVVDDAAAMYRLARDMRTPFGRVYFKRYGGKMHIVLKGNPRLRTILSGTRYGVRNAKVVGMGLGRHGAIKSAKGGTVITIVFLTIWNIVDYVVRDEATLGGLIGVIASDVTKAAIAGAIGAAAGAVAAGAVVFSSFALGPLVVAVGVGLLAGYLLDKLDSRFRLTERLQKLCEDGIAKLERAVEEQKRSLAQRGRDALYALGDTVIDLATDVVLEEARRRIRPLIWRLIPTLR